MLAGAEEEFQAGSRESLIRMTAIQSLLAGLFDYAGLYPPASLSLRSAANNYLDYSRASTLRPLEDSSSTRTALRSYVRSQMTPSSNSNSA